MGKDEIEGQLDVCRFLLVGEVNQVCGRLQDAYFVCLIEGLPVGECLYQLRQYALFIRAALGGVNLALIDLSENIIRCDPGPKPCRCD